MNNKKMGNMAPPQLDIDISQADDVACERCGNYTFEQIVLMKRLSAIMSPTGKEVVVPVGPVYACNACGNINKGFLPFKPKTEAEAVSSKEEPVKSSLILEK
jgi:uncharacterized Zn finger protein